VSKFIDDQQLREFVRDVLQEEPKRKQTALEISDRIKAFDAYIARAECSCEANVCKCAATTPTRPTEIEAGDVFEQTGPHGQVLRLHALGVRRNNRNQIIEIFTAGWPAAIVRIPDHGTVKLLRKGTGITKAELRHRRESMGGGWEDGD
jgi:hypothetical protein